MFDFGLLAKGPEQPDLRVKTTALTGAHSKVFLESKKSAPWRFVMCNKSTLLSSKKCAELFDTNAQTHAFQSACVTSRHSNFLPASRKTVVTGKPETSDTKRKITPNRLRCSTSSDVGAAQQINSQDTHPTKAGKKWSKKNTKDRASSSTYLLLPSKCALEPRDDIRHIAHAKKRRRLAEGKK